MTTPIPTHRTASTTGALSVSEVRAAAASTLKNWLQSGLYLGRTPTHCRCNSGQGADISGAGHSSPQGSAVYFVVGDADELNPGVEVVMPPEDRHYGLRDYAVRD